MDQLIPPQKIWLSLRYNIINLLTLIALFFLQILIGYDKRTKLNGVDSLKINHINLTGYLLQVIWHFLFCTIALVYSRYCLSSESLIICRIFIWFEDIGKILMLWLAYTIITWLTPCRWPATSISTNKEHNLSIHTKTMLNMIILTSPHLLFHDWPSGDGLQLYISENKEPDPYILREPPRKEKSVSGPAPASHSQAGSPLRV